MSGTKHAIQHSTRPVDTSVLPADPSGRGITPPGGAHRFAVADRLAPDGGRRHAVLAVATTMIGAYLVLGTMVVAVGLVLVHIGPVTRWDDHVSVWFANRRSPLASHISAWGTFIANTLGVVVVAAVVGVALVVLRHARAALLIAGGLIVELTVFLTGNYLVRRPRPMVGHLGSTPSTFSYPSGHAAATVVLYAGLAIIVTALTANVLLRTVAWIVAIAFPMWVAFSRVYRGQHHVTDVIAGLLLGVGVLFAMRHVALGKTPLGEAAERDGDRVDDGRFMTQDAEAAGARPHLTVIGGRP